MRHFRSALIAAAHTTALTIAAISLPAHANDHPTSSTSARQISGIYPHLAFFNHERECGTGAVVPWAGSLWAITYAPHQPTGSTDKLYQIHATPTDVPPADYASPNTTPAPDFSAPTSPTLTQIIRPESIGGTPANRMIHTESNQLFIGPYAIDAHGNVRTIPYEQMYGRPTATARHLTNPANKIYTATMEEGLYEIDVHTLEVTELFRDEQLDGGPKADLPGYHGKGLYSGQGVLVYANNGEAGARAKRDPRTPSGVLAEWDGESTTWTIIRRNQFTEVTGPGGIHGNPNPDTDPIWTIGWDHRSLILMSRENNQWHTWRLPKASHSYDGAHGWNTEWPRIREIGEPDLLMTMHGTFWNFPPAFTSANARGIRPRSNYLKVIGDFTRWGSHIAFACDDTAHAEFLNKRTAKGNIAAPQSQSNLWFITPDDLDHLGPTIGRGAIFIEDPVRADTPSDPYLLAGYQHRGAFLSARTDTTFTLQADPTGTSQWRTHAIIPVPANTTIFHEIPATETAEWIRAIPHTNTTATITFGYRGNDLRTTTPDPIFHGLASPGQTNVTGGLVRALDGNHRRLAFSPITPDGNVIGYYELNQQLQLRPVPDNDALTYHLANTAIPTHVLTIDNASVLYTDDNGKRWRLPKASSAFDNGGTFNHYRVDREVATERDMFNAAGIIYELPAENAGGFAGIRPIATHNKMIHDYCSYAGLLVISGITPPNHDTIGNPDISGSSPSPRNPHDDNPDTPHHDNPHIITSTDNKTALWVGALDDVWKLGKVRGTGGPWNQTPVTPDTPSDPYLMTGFDNKTLTLTTDTPTTITAQLDITGNGNWITYKHFPLKANHPTTHTFPKNLEAYWIRLTSTHPCTPTATLTYN